MQPCVAVPSLNEEDYCHFCFGAANVHAVFPLGRADLLSVIDNIIGIRLTPEADETFSLCDGCIRTMETFVTFRNKSRSNYETVREAKIMNQAMKRLQPLLQPNMSSSTLCSSPLNGGSAGLIRTNHVQEHLNATREVTITPVRPLNEQPSNVLDESSSMRKRSLYPLNTDSETSAKKLRTEKGGKDKNKFSHIRELMNRFRLNRSREKDMCNGESNSPESIEQKMEANTNTNGHTPVVNPVTKLHPTICKPCVVVVKKLLMEKTVI